MSIHNVENAHNDASSRTKGAIVQEKLFDTKRNAYSHDVMRLFDDVTMDFKDQQCCAPILALYHPLDGTTHTYKEL